MNASNKPMTVKQLIAALKKYPQDSIIVMAGNKEGGSAHTLWFLEPTQLIEADSDYVFADVDPNNPGGNAVHLWAFGSVERQ